MSINTNQIDISEIDGYARQVVGGYVWYVQGVKQTWSKRDTLEDCCDVVRDTVSRLGAAEAFNLSA
jgi:hypothetical protein